jgi:hypothetical protein
LKKIRQHNGVKGTFYIIILIKTCIFKSNHFTLPQLAPGIFNREQHITLAKKVSHYHEFYSQVSFVTQIFHSNQPSHGGDRKSLEVMTSTYPRGTLGAVASLLAATLYQENPDRNHKLWNIA